ncbi:hypothetical protein NDU88_000526 [Pleurodeles waltl]|uniref:Uncharacterized protein n=1 Tax=Pleurodeles waltl TaxID=8319 RepID=A0AAV7P4E7_PLEWA|nr:hypothetical protein NDU88_000526 [Pleurodeles waltl]
MVAPLRRPRVVPHCTVRGWWTLQGADGRVAAHFTQCWRSPGRTCCEGLRLLDRAWRPPGGELWKAPVDLAGLAELVCGDLCHC